MAFPFTFESNFESGDSLEWDSETDTASQLDFPHYSELSRFPWPTAAPFRGAYCMRATLSGGTADAFVTEGDLNIAAAGNQFFRFMVWLSPDFIGTADDTLNIFEVQDSGNVVEATFGLRIVASTNVINFGIGEVAPTSFGSEEIERGKWYTIELDITLDDGVSNDGTIDLFVTPEDSTFATVVHATQVSRLDQGAPTHGVLGIQNHLATTTGVILFDEFIMDEGRVHPISDRYNEVMLLTKSGHVFVGRGEIDNASLLGGDNTADNVLTIFDTDTADTNDTSNIKIELKNTAVSEVVDPAGTPVEITRGAYVSLVGTEPRALIKVKNVNAFGSPASIRRQGRSQR